MTFLKKACFTVLFLSCTFAHAEKYSQGGSGQRYATPFSINMSKTDSPKRLCGINIRSGARIDAIQFKYCAPGTSNVILTTPRYGGSGGQLYSFDLQGDEYVTALNGFTGNHGGGSRVFGLHIVTNKRSSPLYGSSTHVPFYFQVPLGGTHSIQGFRGWSGADLDSLGVAIEDSTQLIP